MHTTRNNQIKCNHQYNDTWKKKNNPHHSALHDSVHPLPGQDVKFKLPLVESSSARHINAKTQLSPFFPFSPAYLYGSSVDQKISPLQKQRLLFLPLNFSAQKSY